MPYIIKDVKDGFKVCKKDNPSKCFSKKGLSKEKAIKQRMAIGISEAKGGSKEFTKEEIKKLKLPSFFLYNNYNGPFKDIKERKQFKVITVNGVSEKKLREFVNIVKKILVDKKIINKDFENVISNFTFNSRKAGRTDLLDGCDWYNMPTYSVNNKWGDYPFIFIFFKKSDKNNLKILDLINEKTKLRINEKTISFWYPNYEKPDILRKNLNNMFITTQKINPKYPVYVISKGRWDTRFTSKYLEWAEIPYRIVVEPAEYDKYAEFIDKNKILTLPKNYKNKGSIPARNFVFDHSTKEGHKRHWILDDNIFNWRRYYNSERILVKSGVVFKAVEDYVDRYTNILMAGHNYTTFLATTTVAKPIIKNTRIYSSILLSNESPFKWRGRYNEDTDLSLRILKAGYATVLFNAFLASKAATLTVKGGNTNTIYAVKDALYLKAKALKDAHPDVAEIRERFGRIHHYVNYQPFKKNELIFKPGVREKLTTAPNNYTMKLVKRETGDLSGGSNNNLYNDTGEIYDDVFSDLQPKEIHLGIDDKGREYLIHEEDLEGGSNPDAEMVKGLSGMVFDVAESIPGFGDFLGKISAPIKAGLNAITDAIMYDPEWERKQKNKAEWAEYIREMSLQKYGRELTPEEYRYVQWELKKRRMAKLAKERAEAIERDTKKAKEAGFNTIGEYTANIKIKGREDLKERLKRAGFVSGREYTQKKKAGEITEEQRKIVEGGSKSNNFIIVIPTYKREKILKELSLKMLKEQGIPENMINIFVADKTEEQIYKKEIGDNYKIIVGKRGLLDQLRFITDYYKENQKIVRIDDDIKEIFKLKNLRSDYSKGKITRQQLGEKIKVNLNNFFTEAFEICEKEKANLWGVNISNNPFTMSDSISTDLRYIPGGVCGWFNKKDKKYDYSISTSDNYSVEDLEKTLIFYNNDGKVIRFNNYGFITQPIFSEGGIVADIGSKKLRMKKTKEATDLIQEKYKDYGKIVKNKYQGFMFKLNKKPKIEGGSKPLNKELYDKIKEEIYEKVPKHSLFRSAMIAKEYKKRGGKYEESKSKNPLNIKKWFKQKWISLNDYLRGKIVNCGASDTKEQYNEYPLCRPLKIAEKLDKPTIELMIEKKNIQKEKPLKTEDIVGNKEFNVKPTLTGTGKDKFIKQLEKIGLSPESYLRIARTVAKREGYDPKKLNFSLNNDNKLKYESPEGIKNFGKAGYGDFILWSYKERNNEVPKGYANMKRRVFRKSHGAMSEIYNLGKYSPNELAINILW